MAAAGVSKAGLTVSPTVDNLNGVSAECPEHVVPSTGWTPVIAALSFHHRPYTSNLASLGRFLALRTEDFGTPLGG